MHFWFCPGKPQACVKETWSRLIVHYPTLPLVWPVKFGTNLTKTEVDGFEASGFAITTSVTHVPSIQLSMPSEQSLPLPSHVPSSTVSNIRSVHSDLVSIQVVFDGDKRPKHQSGKLF